MNTIEQLDLLNQELTKKIRTISNYQAANSLRTITDSVSRIRTDISKEMVECRRTKKVSKRLEELVGAYEQAIHNLERNVTFALLLNG